jgi:hypothetical protein
LAFWISEHKNSVLLSKPVVAAAVKEKVNADIMISVNVRIASQLTNDFDCKVLYQMLVLMGYRVYEEIPEKE